MKIASVMRTNIASTIFLSIVFLQAASSFGTSESPLHNLAAMVVPDTNDCPTPINGALKGGPGNIQDHMFHSIAIDPKNESIVYAGTETNGIFKTTDGGATWLRLRQGLKCTSYHTGYSQIFNITVDPANSDIVYAATVNGPGPNVPPTYPSASGGVYRSTDGGMSWTQKNNGLPNTYATYVLVDSTDPRRLYVGLGGVKSGFIFAPGFHKGGVYLSTNSGESWAPLPTPTGVDSNIYINMVLRGANANIVYGSAQLHGTDASTAMGFFRSTDKGLTWSISNPVGQTIFAFDAFPKNPNIIYGHDDSPARKVHRSTDGGNTWTQLNTGFYSEPKIHPTDSQTIYFFGRNTISKSTDGLQTVSTVYTDVNLDSTRQMVDIKISQSNPNVVWAAAKGYFLYRTSDAGITWTKITAIRDSVYSATVTLADDQNSFPEEYSLDQNYPNPFNSSTTIPFRISREQHVEIAVYDITGKLIRNLVSQVLSPNAYKVGWDGRDDEGSLVSSALYIVRMTAGNYTASARMTLLK